MLRLAADVPPLDFEEVVGDEGGRQLAHRPVADDLAAQPLLQARKRRQAVERVARIVLRRNEHDKLAVERDAGGQRARQRLEIRIGLRDQLLAARPQPPVIAALEKLRPDAVELPLDDPVGRRPQRRLHRFDRPLPGLREIEGIGPAGVERLRFGMRDLADQRLKIVSGRGAPAPARSRSCAAPYGSRRRRRPRPAPSPLAAATRRRAVPR